jgi:hypothetical protein
MYKFNIERLEEVLYVHNALSKLTKRMVETYLTTDLTYGAQIPQLTHFLVGMGILEENILEENTEERNVSRFNFTNSGSQEN